MRVRFLLRSSTIALSGLLLASIPGCSCAQSSHTAAAQAKKAAALKDLHDSGVLSDEEYAQKLAALQPPARSGAQAQKLATLRELRDSGVISEQEYQQRAAALASGSPAAGTVAVSAGKGSLAPTVPHQLMDRGWGLSWGTITLPAGWGFNGGVIHAGVKGCVATGDSPMWTAESPDKQMGITVLPTLKTNYTTDPNLLRMMQGGGCPMVQARSAAEYLTRYILPHLHKSFQVVGTSDEPAFAQALAHMQQMNAQMDQTAVRSPWMQSRHLADSARVLVSYEEDGRTLHEIASAVVGCSDTMMQMPSIGRPTQPTETVECTNILGMILHVPDDGTPFTVESMHNLKTDNTPAFFKLAQNPAWGERFNEEAQRTNEQIAAEGRANLAASQAQASNQRSEFDKQQAARKEANDYRSNMINKNYQDHQAAMDKVQGGQLSYLSGTNTYTNTATGAQVDLSNQYNHTYMHDNGTTTLQTNSASNPGVNWTELVPKY